MTLTVKPLAYGIMLLTAITFSSCYTDDPGPIQETDRQYTITDFDRLEMGDAFHITVEQGTFFDVSVRGDRRNINDLSVTREGSTLIIRYDESRHRRHDTYVTITMPELYAVNFSGASDSRISGFGDTEIFDVYLSGASVCQLDIETIRLNVVISGASYLNVRGEGDVLDADLSGASVIKAFNFHVNSAELYFSGASDGNVTVANALKVVASHVLYRGQPAITSEVSGSSSVHAD